MSLNKPLEVRNSTLKHRDPGQNQAAGWPLFLLQTSLLQACDGPSVHRPHVWRASCPGRHC